MELCKDCGHLSRPTKDAKCQRIYCTSNARLLHILLSVPSEDFSRVFREVEEVLSPESTHARMFPVS